MLSLLLVCLPARPQLANVDSLLNELQNIGHTPTEQAKLYREIAHHYAFNDLSQFKKYAEKGLDLAQTEEVNDSSMVIDFYHLYGMAYQSIHLDTTLIYLDKGLELAKKTNNLKNEISLTLTKGASYTYWSKADEATECYFKALQLVENTAYRKNHINILVNISTEYERRRNYEKAEHYIRKAIDIGTGTPDSLELSNAYSILTSIRNYYGQKEEALKYEIQALNLARKKNNKAEKIIRLQGVANMYVETGDYNEAEKYAVECLQVAEEYKSPYFKMVAYHILSNVYLYQRRYKECREAATQSLSQGHEIIPTVGDMYLNLTITNAVLNDWEEANNYRRKYSAMWREHAEDLMHTQVAEQEVRYETEKKEQKIATMEKERILYTCIIILVVAVSIALLVIYLYNRRLSLQKIKQLEQKKQIEVSQSMLAGEAAERKRLARELHDGLGGMLSAVKINLDSIDHLENARSLLDHSIEELRRVARNLMPVALLNYGLKTSIDDFCRAFPHVHFHFYGEDRRIAENIELLVYRCVVELVNNAIKHSKAENIGVQLIQNEEKLLLTVHDDGTGFDPSQPKQGLGLKNLADRLTIHNGTLDINSAPGQGTEINLELPLTAARK
jgi:signal transduction histidine kinase